MTTAQANHIEDADDARQAEDRPKQKRSVTRRVATPQNALAAVATAAAAFFAYRSEFLKSQPAVGDSLSHTVAELNTTVKSLTQTVQRLEAKVDALTDAKASFEATLNSFRLNIQNTEYRLGRVETDLARIPNSRNKP